MRQQKVAFIGLGVMGYPMSGYLSKMGYETKVYNRTKATADRWVNDYTGAVCDTPKEAAIDCIGRWLALHILPHPPPTPTNSFTHRALPSCMLC